MDDDKITYFAETDARNKRVKFGIKAKDRTRHVYVLGKTGMGKSTLLENMAVQDIKSGEGICFIDPHGKTADLLMEYVPKERVNDVIYIAPFDTEYPISFNVLESVDQDKRHLVVSGLMSTFKKIWEDAWSARMEYILTNTLLALLEAPGSTLLGVNRMLSDKDYRREIVSHIKDPSVKAFWTKEFASYTERMAAEAVPAIQNKVGQFTANPLIRNMIGQPHSSFDFREAMDRRKIILINLSKGKIGDENMKLLGGLLVTKIYLAAMSRSDVHDRAMKLLPNFYLFVDEFQNFANASFADILSEARKYKLNLTIAHQYVEQMDELVRPAVFGNVGTMIIFRVGATDAEALENEFTPQFTIEDLVNLGFAQIYLKLMIDGLTSPPFSAVTLPPIPHPDSSYVQEIIAASRKQFSRPRADVEAEVIKFHEPIPKPPPAAVTATAKPSSTAKTPSPKTPAAAQPMPPKQPAPAPTHKPFAVLKQVVVPTPSAAKPSAQPVSPASSASTPVPQASTPVPVQPAPAPVKPVPLSFLAPKPAPRVDPKVPVKKNVDDLRSALSAALGGKLPTPVPAQEPLRETSLAKPIEKTQPARPPQETASAEPAAPKREAPKGPPKEVPEEILKKLLKMEE
ncbi:MAG: type IV secretion system DNA-binding domain-containing protein [Minisyncoccia bacterium]|jgi:energy-coupling factor transporter ATP-binding protein EcfA2